jgi:hypothetical protein
MQAARLRIPHPEVRKPRESSPPGSADGGPHRGRPVGPALATE